MRLNRKPGRLALASAAVLAAVTAVTGCASASAPGGTSGPPAARVVRLGGSKDLSVVLSPAGARRIGVQTAKVAGGSSGDLQFPYSALVYEPDGTPAVYVNVGPLEYTRYFVSVDSINGGTVYVKSGVRNGMNVVTQGAEELLGAQNGVGEET